MFIFRSREEGRQNNRGSGRGRGNQGRGAGARNIGATVTFADPISTVQEIQSSVDTMTNHGGNNGHAFGCPQH